MVIAARNYRTVIALSVVLTVLYVAVPTMADPKADYGRFADILYVLSQLYLLLLPAVLGVAAAVLLKGPIGERIVKLLLALALPLLVGTLVWGQGGLSSDSFRIGLILLGAVALIYGAAGVIAVLLDKRAGA